MIPERKRAQESAEDWQRRKDLFAEAIEEGPDRWRSFLNDKCGSNQELLHELSVLIAIHFEPSDADVVSVGKPAIRSSVPYALPPRFELLATVGWGTFGDVYKVHDKETSVEVALKVLRRATPDALLRFKREFRRISDLRHPNIVRLYDLLEVQPAWMFTMQFIDGVDFATFHAEAMKNPPGSELRIRKTLTQLADAVHALHERGLLHRDVKPSNVLVSADHRLTLLDFGLVRQIEPVIESPHTVAGTVPYMSPEQYLGQPLSFAADWYSVGVMLYEALTGKLPFERTLFLVPRPPLIPPAVLRPGTAKDLNELCCGLLAHDPGQRLGYNAIVECLLKFHTGREIPAAGIPSTSSSRFVGRKSQLAALWEGYSEVLRGTLVTICVEGSSGIGKTALVSEFVERVQAKDVDALVFKGSCHQNESIRYNGLDELVDAITLYLQKLTETKRERLLPRNFQLLAQMFPVFMPLASRSAPPPHQTHLSVEMRTKAHNSLIEMLGRLGERNTVVLFIDDLQWIDPDTRLFLEELLTTPDSPRLLLVLSHRDEDTTQNPDLKLLKQQIQFPKSAHRASSVFLDRLPHQEAAQMAHSLIPESREITSERLRWIVDQADGDPFLIQHFVSWSLSSNVALQDIHELLRMDDVILLRVGFLDKSECWLLELISLAGQPTQASVFKQVLGTATFFRVRDSLLKAKLIRSGRADAAEKLDVYHGRIRSAIQQSMEPSHFRSGHAELAGAMEAIGGSVADRLSVHYLHAGDPERAGRCALDSAEQAANALAFHKAVDFYRIALASTTWTLEERRTVLKKLGDAYSNANRGEDAAEAYLQAAEGAEGRERLHLLNSAAGQLLRSGRIQEGAKLLDRVLAESALGAPENRFLLLAYILWWRVKSTRRHTVAEADSTSKASDHALLRMDACWAAAAGFGMIDPLRSAAFSAQYVGLARNSGEPRRVSLALAMEAAQICYTSRAGKQATVRALLDKATLLARQSGDPHASGFVKMTSGVVAYLSGQWATAIAHSNEAIQILSESCTGVSWELTTASIFSFLGRSARGNWSENRKRLASILKDGHMRGDLYSTHGFRILACCHLIDLAAGDADKALAELKSDVENSPPGDYSIQKCGSLANEADIHIYLRTPAKAWSRFEKEWPLVRHSQFLRLQPVYVYSTFTRTRVALAMAAQQRRGSRDEQYFLSRALKYVRALERNGPAWSAGLPSLLRCQIHSFNPRKNGLRGRLIQAELLLREADIVALYCAASYWRSLLTGEPVLEEVLSWFQTEKIAEPERFMFTMAPGAWHDSAPGSA